MMMTRCLVSTVQRQIRQLSAKRYPDEKAIGLSNGLSYCYMADGPETAEKRLR